MAPYLTLTLSHFVDWNEHIHNNADSSCVHKQKICRSKGERVASKEEGSKHWQRWKSTALCLVQELLPRKLLFICATPAAWDGAGGPVVSLASVAQLPFLLLLLLLLRRWHYSRVLLCMLRSLHRAAGPSRRHCCGKGSHHCMQHMPVHRLRGWNW